MSTYVFFPKTQTLAVAGVGEFATYEQSTYPTPPVDIEVMDDPLLGSGAFRLPFAGLWRVTVTLAFTNDALPTCTSIEVFMFDWTGVRFQLFDEQDVALGEKHSIAASFVLSVDDPARELFGLLWSSLGGTARLRGDPTLSQVAWEYLG